MDVLFAASRICSEIMLILHSFVSIRFLSVSFALSKPPAKPKMNRGGS